MPEIKLTRSVVFRGEHYDEGRVISVSDVEEQFFIGMGKAVPVTGATVPDGPPLVITREDDLVSRTKTRIKAEKK